MGLTLVDHDRIRSTPLSMSLTKRRVNQMQLYDPITSVHRPPSRRDENDTHQETQSDCCLPNSSPSFVSS
jgi:hypothetical protein